MPNQLDNGESAGLLTDALYASGVKSYALRAGRETDAQKRAYDSLAPQFVIPNSPGVLDFAALFGNANPVVMEIGFGMGEATAAIAEENPGVNYLGVEVYKAGVGRLLWNISQRGISNIKIAQADAVEVVAGMLPGRSLAGVHLFFPDPWPKKRHHKRRLIKRPFTDALASKIKPGGYLYMATDWEDYAQWALAELGATAALVNAFEEFAPAQAWRPRTSFERKGLEKSHVIRELYFTVHE
ncbi:MAG: tRNA (guanosine(46)-N7)-methyltransferase TrmB [Treponema sp.]|nr:tRNA (guanosine(46)-N7)-methyltransferase TrmB [Treponema sp.]